MSDRTPSAQGLTVAAVMVDLGIRLDLHGGAVGNLGDPAVHGGAHHQVVVLVDAFELLPDGQLLVPGLERDLHLPRELAPCGGGRRRGQPLGSAPSPRLNSGSPPWVWAEVLRGEFSRSAAGVVGGVHFLKLNF